MRKMINPMYYRDGWLKPWISFNLAIASWINVSATSLIEKCMACEYLVHIFSMKQNYFKLFNV